MDVIKFFALFLLFMSIITAILSIGFWVQDRVRREFLQQLDDSTNLDLVGAQHFGYRQVGLVKPNSDMADWLSDLKSQGFGEDWVNCDETEVKPCLHLVRGVTAEQVEIAMAEMNSSLEAAIERGVVVWRLK